MLVKIHNAYRKVVAICDSELLGKTFEEGRAVLNLKENFYKGDDKNEQETIEIMKDLASGDATFNIVGKQSCNSALKAGIISKEGIRKVQGIPFALVLL